MVPMRLTDAPIRVDAEYDSEAHVWVADSDDVPGLVVEHADLDTLSDMVAELVPMLLTENGMLSGADDARDLPIEIVAQGKTFRTAPLHA
jgi:hypothetical protein